MECRHQWRTVLSTLWGRDSKCKFFFHKVVWSGTLDGVMHFSEPQFFCFESSKAVSKAIMKAWEDTLCKGPHVSWHHQTRTLVPSILQRKVSFAWNWECGGYQSACFKNKRLLMHYWHTHQLTNLCLSPSLSLIICACQRELCKTPGGAAHIFIKYSWIQEPISNNWAKGFCLFIRSARGYFNRPVKRPENLAQRWSDWFLGNQSPKYIIWKARKNTIRDSCKQTRCVMLRRSECRWMNAGQEH